MPRLSAVCEQLLQLQQRDPTENQAHARSGDQRHIARPWQSQLGVECIHGAHSAEARCCWSSDAIVYRGAVSASLTRALSQAASNPRSKAAPRVGHDRVADQGQDNLGRVGHAAGNSGPLPGRFAGRLANQADLAVTAAVGLAQSQFVHRRRPASDQPSGAGFPRSLRRAGDFADEVLAWLQQDVTEQIARSARGASPVAAGYASRSSAAAGILVVSPSRRSGRNRLQPPTWSQCLCCLRAHGTLVMRSRFPCQAPDAVAIGRLA